MTDSFFLFSIETGHYCSNVIYNRWCCLYTDNIYCKWFYGRGDVLTRHSGLWP